MKNPLAKDLDHILDHTKWLWEELCGQRIFITGGTGFFGSWLLESFLWANHRLCLNARALVLTRNLEAFKKKAPHLTAHPSIDFHRGDVCFFEFPEGEFSHIIHAATESSTNLNQEDPFRMLQTIILGTKHTLDFAVHSRAKKLLMMSSGAVYGRQPPEMHLISEDYQGAPDTRDPRSAYGEGKRVAELLCSMSRRNDDLSVKIARCFSFVGPYLPLDVHFAIGNFIRDGMAGGPIRVSGDGTPYRSYLYAADLMIWLWSILFRGNACTPYNVGSETSISIAELANTVAMNFRPQPKIYFSTMADPGKPPDRYVPSVKRARSELGLELWVDLGEAIRRTVDWINSRSVNHYSDGKKINNIGGLS